MAHSDAQRQEEAVAQRWRLLAQLDALLDGPMTALAFVWLGLLVLDFTAGLSGWLAGLSTAIWVLFGAHFLLELLVAPDRGAYLRGNWLTALALVLPALRVFRVLRVVRAVRAVGLVRLLSSLNRGMGAARRLLHRHAVGYVALLTLLVTVAGAAGMSFFESPRALREAGYGELADRGAGLDGYGEALWWTAMMMTTMGSEYWPKTPEGRLLGLLLAVYAFAIFGYLTATIASYFVGRPNGGEEAELAALRREIAALRQEVAALARRG